MRCNRCGDRFDVEKRPGALMFGHPDKSSVMWKAHICQRCERLIVRDWKRKPKARET